MVPLSFKQISERLKEINLPEVDIVIGIGSGGIPPATFVAFHLNAELLVMAMNYRDEQNNPRHESPVLLKKPEGDLNGKKLLLVDDVSVSGKTMNAALDLLKGHNVKTLAMKGKADYVLFPEIQDCVKWPWKP
jgi:uncharacterized protein